jgi:endonuclease/exonuclease/phosphatase family metal-dependent hydrolase
MRVATFNLESLDLPPRAARPIEARIEMLRPELERAAADILCLQEVNGQRVPGEPLRVLAALDLLLEGTRYQSYYRSVTHHAHDQGVADVHNLVTLSRLPVLSSRSICHDFIQPLRYRLVTAQPPTQDDEEIGFDRPALVTEVATADGPALHVINCHLRAPLASSIEGQKQAPFVWNSISGWAEGFCISSIKRNAQALEIRLFVDQLLEADRHAEIIVTGDFNAEDNESPLRILVGAEQDTGNGALAASSMIILDRGLPEDRRFSVVHQGRPQMLDHVLCSRALYGRFKNIQVYNEALSDEAVAYARVDRPTGSSHACVVAEFADISTGTD